MTIYLAHGGDEETEGTTASDGGTRQQIEKFEGSVLGDKAHEKFESLGIDSFVENNLIPIIIVAIVLIVGIVMAVKAARKNRTPKNPQNETHLP